MPWSSYEPNLSREPIPTAAGSTRSQPAARPRLGGTRCRTSRLMRRLIGINGNAERTLLRRTVSPLGGGVLAQFLWAVPLAVLLWVAAAWAMGWLP